MAPVRIRVARPADHATLVRLEKETFGRRRPYGTRGLRDVLEKHYGQAILAESEKTSVGFAIFHAGWDDKIEGYAEIALMGVATAAQRQGLGTRLLRWIAKHAASRSFGAGWLRLGVRDSNRAARAFYERLGFEEFETTHYLGGEPRHNLQMRIAAFLARSERKSPAKASSGKKREC